MQVSVVIPTYNRAGHITRAIDSILAQTYRHYEIIVVDDGSTDETSDVLASYSNRIRYLYQDNAGPAAARNCGVQHSCGAWIAFLDSDDVWAPNKLERQLSQCLSLNADLSFHDLSFPNQNGQDISSWNDHVYKKHVNLMPLKTGILLDAYQRMMTTGHVFLTTTFLVKRAAICDVGCFNETLRTSEDLDLYFRLAARYRVAYLAETLAVYTPASYRVTDSERLYRDRIQAIRRSLDDRLKSHDLTLAKLARNGLLQEVRSLAGFYLNSGSYSLALSTYIKYFLSSMYPLSWHVDSNASS
jgi:glycosyltransferase involved in cell wall biosynthesis